MRTALGIMMALALSKVGYGAEYTFSNPAPVDKKRELSTDRPDKTESPITVDAGYFQMESDFISTTFDSGDRQSSSYLATNLKLGLTHTMDVQIVINPWTEERVGEDSSFETGFGDTTLRLKWNLLGNDGGPFAIGLMPFVKVPTAKDKFGNKKYEGGLILPVSLTLTEEWDLGLMLEINYEKNEEDGGFHNVFISSITTSHSLLGELSGYTEFYSETSKDSDWEAYFDVGLTYGLSPDHQLDAGVNWGITKDADDYNYFAGFSIRT
ncbi:MAG: transporter [Bdellovibrionota bacterium]